ncbi:MAG: glycosyltransferase family 4 protein [Chloroflexi bacterium]|nr:MAG: glycosyltransferase family 4 protein [Chloroflexota bacterium]
MRIGINALFLQKPATGMGQHLLHLLEGLDSLDEKDQQYMLLAPRFRRAYTVRAPQLSDRFREVEVVSALARLGENVEQVWWEQVGIVLAGMREKIDLLHCPYWSNPVWSPWPTVVTVHDVIQFVLPEYAWRKISRLYFGLVSAGARRADAVITVSQCSKQDIMKILGLGPERIHVIGNAVDASLFPVRDAWLLAKVRERYGIAPRFVLYFGGFDMRKNVPRLIEAYGQLPERLRREYQLVIAGRYQYLGHPLYPDPRETVRRLGLQGNVIFTGQIREQDKAPLYSAATVFAFPSLYEGFGMPVLEAMACGTPVVTSDVSALPEVAGDAGSLVDPYSSEAICAALSELLESAARRDELARRGLERARRFTWPQVAEQTVRVYKQILCGP